MELDLDALTEKTINVKVGGKSIEVQRLNLKAYINALSLREKIAAGKDSEEVAAAYIDLAFSLSGDAIPKEELWKLSFGQLKRLAVKLDKFHSDTSEGDGGNPVPGAA